MNQAARKMLAVALATLLAIGGLTISSGAAASASSVPSLPEPKCYDYRTGPLLTKKTDCSAQDTWRAFRNVVNRGTPEQVMLATDLILAPASERSGTKYDIQVRNHAGSSRFCNALAVNTFLNEAVKKKELIGNGRALIELVLKIPAGRGTSFAKGQFKQVLPLIWEGLAREALRSSAVSAVLSVVNCK